MKRSPLISLLISTGCYSQFIDHILALASAWQSSYICVANVHMLMEARRNPQFADIVNGANEVLPDGMPLVNALRLVHGLRQDRVAGMDLLPDLISACVLKGISVYIYGGTEEMLISFEKYCQENHPGLRIAGIYSPPFRPLAEEENQLVVDRINQSKAGLVFVVLGCPKQERWMASMRGRIHACMIGVGGALPVVAGLQKRAPVWMQKSSLEWLYRLKQEPRRLFLRYASTNIPFVFLLFGTLLKREHHLQHRKGRQRVH